MYMCSRRDMISLLKMHGPKNKKRNKKMPDRLLL